MLVGTILLASAGEIKCVEVVRVVQPPVIDGVLSDSCWVKMKPVGGFVEIYPVEGGVPVGSTEVYIGYDEGNIYVGFRCYKVEDNPVVANSILRDSIEGDDAVMVMFDTFHDGRNCYLFGVNPLNTQVDGRVGKDGDVVDMGWDADWESSTNIDRSGWSAEMRIPLGVMQFKAGHGITWGVNFVRVDVMSNAIEPEVSGWMFTGSEPFRVARFGEAKFEQLEVPEVINVSPYVTMDNVGIGDFRAEVGGEVWRSFGQGYSITFTVNTTEMWVEADPKRLRIEPMGEERFSLPEKRRFFVGDNLIFWTPMEVLNTRRVEKIKYGLKVAGRAGEYGVTYFRVETEEPKNVYSLLGVERGFGKNLVVSWMDLKKSGVEDNHVMVVNASVGLPNEFRGCVCYSWNMGETEGNPYAMRMEMKRNTSKMWINTGYEMVAPYYQTEMGEVEGDRKGYWVEGGYNFRNLNIGRITPCVRYAKYTSYGGEFVSSMVDAGIEWIYRNGLGVGIGYLEDEEAMGMDYHEVLKMVYVTYNTGRWAPKVKVTYFRGKEAALNVFVRSKIGKKIAMEVECEGWVNSKNYNTKVGVIYQPTGNIRCGVFIEKNGEIQLNGGIIYGLKGGEKIYAILNQKGGERSFLFEILWPFGVGREKVSEYLKVSLKGGRRDEMRTCLFA